MTTDAPDESHGLPNTSVTIIPGGAPSHSVDLVAKMLWLEGFAYPTIDDGQGGRQYAVVARDNIQAVLTNLYEVEIQARLVIRYLRQVGLIEYAPPLDAGGQVTFRYVCAKAFRGRDPKTLDDVDGLIKIHQTVMSMMGDRMPPLTYEDEDEDHRGLTFEPVELAELTAEQSNESKEADDDE